MLAIRLYPGSKDIVSECDWRQCCHQVEQSKIGRMVIYQSPFWLLLYII